jgi:glycosyltransferase involved in cell wall biosynthesis
MINIIISHYKHQCYLPDAIAALKDQMSIFRILLFNDEPGIDLLSYFSLGYNSSIYTFDDVQNKGQAVRFNEGIKLSIAKNYKADWVAFHGADDIAMPWKISCFSDDDDFDVLYTDAVQLNANNQRSYIKSEQFDIEELKRRNFIVASTVFVRTELAAEVLFDEDLRYGEDWLFYHKLYRGGARFRYIPIPTMYYRDYTSNIGVRYGPEWDQNRQKVIDKVKELYK